MKKLLTVFDGEHFSNAAFDFACRLNEQQPVLLTGVFVPTANYSDIMFLYMGEGAGPLYLPPVEDHAGSIENNILKFKELCEKNGLDYRVHKGIFGEIVSEIKQETRYADVLILSSELFYKNLDKDTQNEYLKDTIHKAECPIVVLPEHYDFPSSIVIAYDGSESSVYAIKQFAYLFPEFKNVHTLIVHASDSEGNLPDMSYIEELAARHFTNLTFFKLEADPQKYFNTWITEYGSALLVTGSYGRSAFSEIFRKSFVADIINDRKVPVFIAHK